MVATGKESGIGASLEEGKPNKNYIGCEFVRMGSPHEPSGSPREKEAEVG